MVESLGVCRLVGSDIYGRSISHTLLYQRFVLHMSFIIYWQYIGGISRYEDLLVSFYEFDVPAGFD